MNTTQDFNKFASTQITKAPFPALDWKLVGLTRAQISVNDDYGYEENFMTFRNGGKNLFLDPMYFDRTTKCILPDGIPDDEVSAAYALIDTYQGQEGGYAHAEAPAQLPQNGDYLFWGSWMNVVYPAPELQEP